MYGEDRHSDHCSEHSRDNEESPGGWSLMNTEIEGGQGGRKYGWGGGRGAAEGG